MKRIIKSLAIVIAVGAIAGMATYSFFSDTETSAGNTFSAGELDLAIDNTSYYNGVLNDSTTWQLTEDLDDGNGPSTDGKYLFFDFRDLKPGDWGEDTISLHAKNDAWACMEIDLTAFDDNGLTEPEEDDGDTTGGVGEGELQNFISFAWWADDGDNVLEDDETDNIFFTDNLISALDGLKVTLADSQGGIFGPDPLVGENTYYIGKAWCFGEMTMSPLPAGDGVNPSENSGITCDGGQINNVPQSDSVVGDISFSAIQSRHNPNFVCEGCDEETVYTATVTGNDQGTLKDDNPITDPNRTDPSKANGAPDWVSGTGTNFYSLGRNSSGSEGWVILKFSGVVGDGAGADLSIHEATNGRDAYPTESAKVEVSLDGSTWYNVGTASSEPGGDGVSFLDVSSTPLNTFQYVRLTDTTNYGPQENNADGFDLDAVDAVYGSCE